MTPISECPAHEAFVKAVLHRCIDLGWKEARMVKEAGISPSHWSEIRNKKKSPSVLTMVKVAKAVGLEIQFRLN